MRTISTLRLLPLFLVLCISCQKHKTQPDAEVVVSPTLDWSAMAGVIMQRINIEPGEKILFVAGPGQFDSLVVVLRHRIIASRGIYLGTISTDSSFWPGDWKTEFTNGASRTSSTQDLTQYFNAVDLAIMLPGATVSHPPYKAMQDVLKSGTGRTIHFHWSGAYALDGTPLTITDSVGQHYQNALLETDYRRLSELQQFFEEAARQSGIHVITPLGTDLRFKLGDRPVTKQDGDASKARTAYARNLVDREIELPAGAIRVAPIEESVEGTIAFPDTKWSGQPVTGLVLTIKGGKVVDIKATTGLDAVRHELDSAGQAGYAFREFALGFNPLLAVPDKNPWIPYYGYGAGVVRLSLGDNSELGGKVNGGYVRWNFFTDATVKLGERVIVDAGKMLR